MNEYQGTKMILKNSPLFTRKTKPSPPTPYETKRKKEKKYRSVVPLLKDLFSSLEIITKLASLKPL